MDKREIDVFLEGAKAYVRVSSFWRNYLTESLVDERDINIFLEGAKAYVRASSFWKNYLIESFLLFLMHGDTLDWAVHDHARLSDFEFRNHNSIRIWNQALFFFELLKNWLSQ